MSEIDICILGTTAGIPTRKRGHPAIYLSHKDRYESCYLFDCGEGTQRQILLAGLNPMKINEIFITHWHGDHYFGLPGLIDTMGFEGRERPLTIYGPEAKKMISHLLSLGYISRRFDVIPKDVPSEGNEITELLDTPSFKIASIPAKHGVPAVSYAFIEKEKKKIDKDKARQLGLPEQGKIYKEIKEKGGIFFQGRKIEFEDISLTKKGKKVVYSGDTEICDNLMKLAEGADLLIQDCTYFDTESFEDRHHHASLKDIVNVIDRIKVKKILLTHISRRYKDEDVLEEMVRDYPNIDLARDFMKIKI